jgi:hypothetical protein
MKANGHFFTSIVVRFSILTFLSVGLLLGDSGTVYAGGLYFSRTWKILQTKDMPREKIQLAVMECETIRAYADMEGHLNGATIVKGPTSKNPHIIVNLYKNGNFEKSCHVYINKKFAFENCNCTFLYNH